MRKILPLILVLSCTEKNVPATIEAPGMIRQSLQMVRDIDATAELVPEGERPLDGIPLEAADDGVSFTGFLASEPGTYTLEIVFTGVHDSGPERIFMGRWVSDVFTVALGDTVTPVFSGPIDTIGRNNEGDEDMDGFGLLDELFWETDPNNTDSDGDGVLDGQDCDPNDGTKDFVIIGSIRDCDGDDERRVIDPYEGPAGTDCNDYDASIRPGAQDLCDDMVDQDCNPETCPLDDSEGPAIAIIDPTPMETVGCHRRIRASVVDPAGVQTVKTELVSAGGAVEAEIDMRPDGVDEYITSQFDISVPFWIDSGPQAFRVRATDARGNVSVEERDLLFAMDVPQITIAPATLGDIDSSTDITVTVATPHTLVSVELFLASWPDGSDVDRATEVSLGSAATSPATFTLDPSTLADGRYALYAVAIDSVGNQSRPEPTFSPDSEGASFSFEPDFYCLFDPGTSPLREVVIGQVVVTPPGKEPARMKDHLQEAITLAGQADPNAQLVLIRGFGLEADGYINLDVDPGEGKRWWYEFFNAAEERHVKVTWWSVDFNASNPEVEVTENYAFTPDPIMNVAGLVDSDAAATAFMAAGCPMLQGTSDDDIRYMSDLPFSADDVLRMSAGGASDWKATAVAPITEKPNFSCN